MKIKNPQKLNISARRHRHQRIRTKIIGTESRPRLSAFRSNRHLYVQLIDDKKGHTLAAVYDTEIKAKNAKQKIAFLAGELIAQKALKLNIKEVVFDKGAYEYHGRIKAVADGARQGGLKF